MILFLRILSAVMLLVAVILFVLHFVIDLSMFWFSIPLSVGIVANLIAPSSNRGKAPPRGGRGGS